MIHESTVDCPYCGEPFTIVVDGSAGDQRYIEDCAVCCRPIDFTINVDGAGEPTAITVQREDD